MGRRVMQRPFIVCTPGMGGCTKNEGLPRGSPSPSL